MMKHCKAGPTGPEATAQAIALARPTGSDVKTACVGCIDTDLTNLSAFFRPLAGSNA
jgi:hypothetical protein